MQPLDRNRPLCSLAFTTMSAIPPDTVRNLVWGKLKWFCIQENKHSVVLYLAFRIPNVVMILLLEVGIRQQNVVERAKTPSSRVNLIPQWINFAVCHTFFAGVLCAHIWHKQLLGLKILDKTMSAFTTTLPFFLLKCPKLALKFCNWYWHEVSFV